MFGIRLCFSYLVPKLSGLSNNKRFIIISQCSLELISLSWGWCHLKDSLLTCLVSGLECLMNGLSLGIPLSMLSLYIAGFSLSQYYCFSVCGLLHGTWLPQSERFLRDQRKLPVLLKAKPHPGIVLLPPYFVGQHSHNSAQTCKGLEAQTSLLDGMCIHGKKESMMGILKISHHTL